MTATMPFGSLEQMAYDFYTYYDLKAMLVGNGFVFDKQTHTRRSDVVDEKVGTGYTPGGIVLNGVDVVTDHPTSRVYLVAEDADFGVVTLTGVTQLVVYTDSGNPSNDRIVSVHTFSPKSPTNENFTYFWDTSTIAAFGKGAISYFSY